MIEKKPTQEDMENLIDALADVLSEASDFFTARDEMNAKVHLAEPRWSPITLRCRAGVEAWRRFRYPAVEVPQYDGPESEYDGEEDCRRWP